jgi:type I restriction enzyme S subunit
MNSGTLDLSKASRFVPRSYYDSLQPNRRAQRGDVLYSVTGSFGIPALVEDDESFVFQRHIALLRPRVEFCDARWLSHILASPQMFEQGAAIATGTAQLTVPLNGLRSLKLPAVGLPEQRRIVAKIDSLIGKSTRARDHLDHVPRLVEKYKQAILAAAFRGDLTREWRAKLNHEGEWELATPSAYFTWSSGKNLPSKRQVAGDVPVIGGNGIGGYHNEALIDFPTLVVGRVGAQCGNVHFSSGPAWITDNAIFARSVSDQIDLLYAVLFFRNANLNQLAGGSGQPYINQTTLNALTLPLPAIEEQREIVRLVEMALNWVDRLAADATSARKLIDHLDQSVLAKAFKGELVAQDPTDEPASALLERIQAERAAAPRAKRGCKKAA